MALAFQQPSIVIFAMCHYFTNQFMVNKILLLQQLAEELSSFCLDEDDILASRDVVASFTSTPIKKSQDVIRETLEQNPEWKYTTLLETYDIMEVLEFILSIMYFSFRGQIFRQKFGTAMGSPVSPLVANMFMEHLEEKLHATVPKELKLQVCKRYVDDILEVLRKGSVEELTEFVNKLDESGSVRWNKMASYNFISASSQGIYR